MIDNEYEVAARFCVPRKIVADFSFVNDPFLIDLDNDAYVNDDDVFYIEDEWDECIDKAEHCWEYEVVVKSTVHGRGWEDKMIVAHLCYRAGENLWRDLRNDDAVLVNRYFDILPLEK